MPCASAVGEKVRSCHNPADVQVNKDVRLRVFMQIPLSCCQVTLSIEGQHMRVLGCWRVQRVGFRAAQAAQLYFGEVKKDSLAEPGTWAYPGYVETGLGALNQARHRAAGMPEKDAPPPQCGLLHACVLRIQH